MPVNLLNEKDLNSYLSGIMYNGQKEEVFKSGDLKNAVFVEQNKDTVVRAMLMQWSKHRLRSYLAEDLPEHREFLKPVKLNEPDLPVWAERCLAQGKRVYRFTAAAIPERMTADIGMIRDFLYAKAEIYINKTLDAFRQEKSEAPLKLNIDFLKTNNEFDTFAKALEQARKWHEIMAQKAELRQHDEAMYKASLPGTHSVMKFPDGMEIVQLTTPEALDFESDYMGHCVGNGNYDKGVNKGIIRIYSLRDADGMPHATFDVRTNEKTKKEEIHQCKGKGNKAPVAKYRPYVQEFVNAQKFDIVGDEKNIGLVKLYDKETKETKYYDIFNIPKGRKFICKGDLDLSGMGLTELPDLSNITVEGSFRCSGNKLTSLKGAPQKVGKYFDCSQNQLTSLEYAPQEVKGSFYCNGNLLTSLKGAPQKVGKNFCCSGNKLTSLKGAPRKVGGDFRSYDNQLTSLEGAPQKVGKVFDCSINKLTSLKGAPQEVGENFNCSENRLTSLEGAPRKVGGCFYCSYNKLTSLQGAPREVGIDFTCDNNELTSLEGMSKKVGRDFNCSNNKLSSLMYSPQKVGRYYSCFCNPLASLQYVSVCDKVNGDIIKAYDAAKCYRYGIPYEDLIKTSRFVAERQELINKKRATIRLKIKRREAAKNVSAIRGHTKQKRTGKAKLTAKINLLFARVKEFLRH